MASVDPAVPPDPQTPKSNLPQHRYDMPLQPPLGRLVAAALALLGSFGALLEVGQVALDGIADGEGVLLDCFGFELRITMPLAIREGYCSAIFLA